MPQADSRPFLARARSAFEAHRWSEALDGFQQAGGVTVLDAEDVERFAWSVTWTGQSTDRCLDAFERAEAAFRDRGDGRGASRAALEQARIHALAGDGLVSAACWDRALEHLHGDATGAEFGMVMAVAGLARLLEADMVGVREAATMARESGRGSHDPTVESTALYLLGHASILGGEVAPALGMLDRSMSIAMTGAVHPMYAGLIYCGLLWGCREIGDWRRARQWHEVAARWCQRESVAHFPAHLSAHRAELALAHGRLEEAEQAALAAVSEAGDWHRDLVAWSHALLGEARRRLGETDGAQAAFVRAAQLGYDPEPGHALLLVSQGRPEPALRNLSRAIERPHWYAFSSLIYTLPVGVSIASTLGRTDQAARWADLLAALANAYATPGPRASAVVARGEVALANGLVPEAVAQLADGIDLWRLAEDPYEEGRARLTLARAYDTAGQPDLALVELEAARSTFDGIGARGDASRVWRMIRQRTAVDRASEAAALAGLTLRQRQVAVLVAQGLTNRQIAERLTVSPYTAETHVKHILVRLGCATRAEIAAWVGRHGMLEDAPDPS